MLLATDRCAPARPDKKSKGLAIMELVPLARSSSSSPSPPRSAGPPTAATVPTGRRPWTVSASADRADAATAVRRGRRVVAADARAARVRRRDTGHPGTGRHAAMGQAVPHGRGHLVRRRHRPRDRDRGADPREDRRAGQAGRRRLRRRRVAAAGGRAQGRGDVHGRLRPRAGPLRPAGRAGVHGRLVVRAGHDAPRASCGSSRTSTATSPAGT